MPTLVMAHGWDKYVKQTPEEYLSGFLSYWAAQSYTVILPNFPGQDNYINAGVLLGIVDTLPFDETVHIAGHSMGGLSARYYVSKLGGFSRVASYTSYDTPQYGNVTFCLAKTVNGGQMCPYSAFMRELNAGEMTPAGPLYIQIRVKTAYKLMPGVWSADVEGTHAGHVNDPDVLDRVERAYRGDFSRLTRNAQ